MSSLASHWAHLATLDRVATFSDHVILVQMRDDVGDDLEHDEDAHQRDQGDVSR